MSSSVWYENHSIFIQCPRADLGTEYAQFTVKKDCLEIEHFGTDQSGTYCVKHTEHLLYADHPEVCDVHDGVAWNPVELMIWQISFETPVESVTPRTVPA